MTPVRLALAVVAVALMSGCATLPPCLRRDPPHCFDAHLRNADLRGANLAGAFLIGADLTGANLNGVDLRDADLSLADLAGADLSGADLTGASLTPRATGRGSGRRGVRSGAERQPRHPRRSRSIRRFRLSRHGQRGTLAGQPSRVRPASCYRKSGHDLPARAGAAPGRWALAGSDQRSVRQARNQ